MTRILCMYLPRWPVQRLWHDRPALRDKPIAITRPKTVGGARVMVCCPRAGQAGVRPGMPLAEALAIEPRLVVQPEDPAADRQALRRLAEWAERFSPSVGLEETETPQSLLLDITGCAPCFGGEDRLLRRADRELRAGGWFPRLAIASTLGAAWAFAHAGRGLRIVAAEETSAALASWPVWSLRIPVEVCDMLDELGIERIEQIEALPRTGIPGRFGAAVLQRLDQALGRTPELIVPHRAVPDIQASCSFDYATERRDALNHALEKLVERLAEMLRDRNRVARRLECWFYPEAATPFRIELSLFRPSRSAPHLTPLLAAQLERVRVAQPVRRLCLRATTVELPTEAQQDLFDDDRSRMAELGDLIDRLAGQLGRDAVAFPRLVDDPQPEYACRFEGFAFTVSREPKASAGSAASDNKAPLPRARGRGVGVRGRPPRGMTPSPPTSPPTPLPLGTGGEGSIVGPRPLQVCPEPTPIEVLAAFPEGAPHKFVWTSHEYTVRRCWGPERIETGWWRGCDVQRDYYQVETQLGTRLWIFRRRHDGRWFLHGCFD